MTEIAVTELRVIKPMYSPHKEESSVATKTPIAIVTTSLVHTNSKPFDSTRNIDTGIATITATAPRIAPTNVAVSVFTPTTLVLVGEIITVRAIVPVPYSRVTIKAPIQAAQIVIAKNERRTVAPPSSDET
ncbi:hypothetical protein M0E87_09110 [Corynebacterium sp. CCM 9185]|uniref:Uncharacterized protein n=1 Tax=Corynebacterium marambiense TaxID=2765364 RepID=A0ABS0VWZ0_9CORY|nr:hypothetical protein [Corynebacterium marambiense]MBI9001260.1 hypothetical protein [Corynebacterium marambiense]MCK7663814.1 hypothetical protein [Corynebacterium marambiense]